MKRNEDSGQEEGRNERRESEHANEARPESCATVQLDAVSKDGVPTAASKSAECEDSRNKVRARISMLGAHGFDANFIESSFPRHLRM